MELLIAEPARRTSGFLPDPVMNRGTFEPVLETMRAELAEHGGLLNLLHQQREAIHDGAWEEASRIEQTTHVQQRVLFALRRRRRAFFLLALPAAHASLSLRRMSHHFPEPMRPLVEAITSEVHRLSIQVRLRRKENRAFSARACVRVG